MRNAPYTVRKMSAEPGFDRDVRDLWTQNLDLQKSVKQAVKDLRKASANTSGPSDLIEAFTNADDYPDFDADPGANYLIGYLRGVAEVLGVEAATFLKG